MSQRAQTTVAECSLTSCVWTLFLIDSHTLPGQRHSQPTRWVNGVCVFRCNLQPALLAEWPGYFTCHCGNTGVERTPKSQHTKLTLKKKILLPLLPGFELATFRSRVRRSNELAIQAPHKGLYWGWKRTSIHLSVTLHTSHLTLTTICLYQHS